jgi:hypothetical protein
MHVIRKRGVMRKILFPVMIMAAAGFLQTVIDAEDALTPDKVSRMANRGVERETRKP